MISFATQLLIPLQNIPQNFSISLAGTNYNMTCKWNDMSQAGWILDIFDQNNVALACNIPLITGADCLEGLEYLGIDGVMIVMTDGDESAVPTLENLGVDSNLYFLTNATSN